MYLYHREVDVVGDVSRFIILSSGRVLELETRRHGFDFADQVQCYNFVSVLDSTADSEHTMKWEAVISVLKEFSGLVCFLQSLSAV